MVADPIGQGQLLSEDTVGTGDSVHPLIWGLTFDPGRGFSVGDMNGHKISQAARATGFSESALRFYEQENVVVPERTGTGYRSYTEENVEALRFVARAKRLGLRLEDISELLGLLRQDECRPVQSRMRDLLTERIAQAHRHLAELVAFTAQLQGTASRLGVHTPDGACDGECGCRSEPATSADPRHEAVPLVGSGSSVACSLEPDRLGDRIEDWSDIVSHTSRRDPLPDGVRLHFPRGIDVAAMARLAADEQTCCGFLAFTIDIGDEAVTLEVAGPSEAQAVIAAMFGVAA
jgi:DNA-binding transcriptional MerR regulator